MTLPRPKEIELPLLQEIEAMGGEAKPKDLYPKIAPHFPQITNEDLMGKVKTGANRWTNRICFTRNDLVKKGEIDKSVHGIWRITEKGRQRLGNGPPPPPPPPPPNGVEFLLAEIKSRLEKLGELTKKKTEKPPLPTHDELTQKLKEMGEMLGKTAEIKWGPVFKHDCVWKDNPYANPKLVMEICDKGNLDKDITSLTWAWTNWGAKGILVIFDEADFQTVRKKLTSGNQIYPIKAHDMVELDSLLKAGNAQAIKLIFNI